MRLSIRLSSVVAATTAILISCSDSTGPTTPELSAGSGLTAAVGLNPVTESATGSGQHHTTTGLWRTFSFNGTKKADGTVGGRFHFRVHDAQGEGSRIWGEITCLTVEGNQAWLAGYVTKAGNPANVGRPHGFRVVDNGQGANAPPDLVTRTWSGNYPTEDYCRDKPDFQPLNVVEAGNIQIHP